VLLRLAYLGVTNAFAMLRLLPMSNREKPHQPRQARDQLPPDAHEQPAATDIGTRTLLRTRILGDLINEYGYAA
jgi:hypothetical protein